jgi:hypothetical protein
MRDCYKKFWKTVLVEKMGGDLPQFTLKEGAARKAADEIKPSTKPINFVWNPVAKLNFTIEFCVPGKQDHFEAWFYWSEIAKAGANGTEALNCPFPEDIYALVNASVMLSALSGAIDGKSRVSRWKFWEPTRELGTSRESHAEWQTEFLTEEMRFVSDEEARQRVEIAVDKAMIDIKRLALPWFEKKLDWYQKNRK